MPKKSELSLFERAKIIELIAKGYKQIKVAQTLKCKQSTVWYTISKCNKQNAIENFKRSGRSKCTTPRDDRSIKIMARRDSSITAREIKESLDLRGLDISKATIKRRLNSVGLFGRCKVKVPLIKEPNRIKRLKYSRRHRDKPMAYWINKLYVDESKFELISNRRRQRVWRGKNESHKRGNTKTVVKHSASVMVWG